MVEAREHLKKLPPVRPMQIPEGLNKNWMFTYFPSSGPGKSPLCANCLEILRIYSMFLR